MRDVAGAAANGRCPARRGPSKEALLKAVILAGSFGTRLSEEAATRPKAMVEIGREPIL
jgi:hypothetical protein